MSFSVFMDVFLFLLYASLYLSLRKTKLGLANFAIHVGSSFKSISSSTDKALKRLDELIKMDIEIQEELKEEILRQIKEENIDEE